MYDWFSWKIRIHEIRLCCFSPIRHGCNYNPQQLDKICLLWFHIGWIISSLFIFISIMFVHTFHCLLHCLGIILILCSNPLFWFCVSTHFLWHCYVTDITPKCHDGYNWKFLTLCHHLWTVNYLITNRFQSETTFFVIMWNSTS